MIIIVKWCSDIACDWCASLDIALILALNCVATRRQPMLHDVSRQSNLPSVITGVQGVRCEHCLRYGVQQTERRKSV